jgi:NADH dehydrogenase
MDTPEKNIVVVGAGYGGITAALRLAKLLRKHPGCRIHLVDKNTYHTLKTQLHEAAVRSSQVSIPIERIIRGRDIVFHEAEITRIDPNEKIVHMKAGELSFDYLVIALGCQANYYGIPGLQEHSFPLQTLDDARSIYDHILSLCERAANESDREKRRDMLRFVVGGGGLSGVEFAAEFSEHVCVCAEKCRVDMGEVEIIVVEVGRHVVAHLGDVFASHIQKKLTAKGIKVLTETRIAGRTQDTVTLSSGEALKTQTVIWTGGIRINDLIHDSGIETGQLGRIIVDEFLRSRTYPFIYAIGDNALALNPVTAKPVAAAAQFALQQGRLVADNIYADVLGGSAKEYYPKVLGEVVSLGRHLAAGWMALPLLKKITFIGFLGSLIKAAIEGKHILLLRKESRNWAKW